MKIKLSSKVLQYYPSLNFVVIVVKDVNNIRKMSSLSQLARGTAVVAKNELKKADRKDLFVRVTEQFVEDGATFLEAYHLANKIKKIQNGKDIEGKNNLLNLVNLISLKHFLPLHGFDLDQAEQDYLISFYQAKKGKKAPELDFLPETKNLVIWFPNLASYEDEELDQLIGEINALFHKYLNVQISEVYHLNVEHQEIDLGYISEKEKEYQAAHPKIEETVQKIEEEIKEEEQPNILNYSEPDQEFFTEEPLAKNQLQDLFAQATETAFSTQLQAQNLQAKDLAEIVIPTEASHGDFSANLAMKLTKVVGQAPQAIAQEILNRLPPNNLIERTEIVGPGFINIWLKKDYFIQEMDKILFKKEHFGLLNFGDGKQVMIEFGSLNMAKPFGAHHLLGTIIGQTLSNLYKVTGHQVITADFPSDWGTQFGKTIYAYKHWGEKEVIEKDPMNEFLKLYVRFHEEAEKEPTLEDAARTEFKKLEDGDIENLKLWEWITQVSQKDIDTVYNTLGIHHDARYPESKYMETCLEILEKGKQLGVFVKGEREAYITTFEEEKLPVALIQKSDGTTLYITRDLASIKDRLQQYPDLTKIIYDVDLAQILHFQQLFAIAKKFHQADPAYFPITELKQVVNGRMSFADKSMSTRKGNIINAKDLIKEGIERAALVVKEKSGDLTENEQKHISYGVAIGAIKYSMISQTTESNLVFDWDKMLSFEGNSAPYLQYTQARANSILRKASETKPTAKVSSQDQVSLFSLDEVKKEQLEAAAEESQEPFGHPQEQALLRLLPEFPEKIAAATQNNKPNLLTNHLYQLAQTFNSFYSVVPVVKIQREDLRTARLKLVEATSQVLKNGLNILGIATFERM